MDSHLTKAIVLLAIPFSGSLHSMPLDNFLSAHRGEQQPDRLEVEISRDFTTDKVDYAPNTTDGGHLSPESKLRYLGQHLGIKLHISPRLSFDGGIWKRQVTSLRDSYGLGSFHGAIQYNFNRKMAETSFAIRLGAWRNSADAFDKNSYTRQGEYLFTSASVGNPNDLQTQINLIGSRKFSSQLLGSLFTGVGFSRIDFDSLSATFRSDKGCDYRFDYQQGSAEINQLGRCGSTTRFRMVLPNQEVIKDELGISPEEELGYTSRYWQLGGSVQWRRAEWQKRLGYLYQKFDRGALDDLIRQQGDQVSTTSHNLQGEVRFHFSRHLGFFFRSEYMSNRLLDMVPFTYNAYTASKFGKSGLLFNSGMLVRF